MILGTSIRIILNMLKYWWKFYKFMKVLYPHNCSWDWTTLIKAVDNSRKQNCETSVTWILMHSCTWALSGRQACKVTGNRTIIKKKWVRDIFYMWRWVLQMTVADTTEDSHPTAPRLLHPCCDQAWRCRDVEINSNNLGGLALAWQQGLKDAHWPMIDEAAKILVVEVIAIHCC